MERGAESVERGAESVALRLYVPRMWFKVNSASPFVPAIPRLFVRNRVLDACVPESPQP